ncbi:MAG: HEPN domain-containing protein [Tannerella sp.]|jgi:HEPN domain-containing protein|nr:HEPN domain-containing protein [Tannerella sp.]
MCCKVPFRGFRGKKEELKQWFVLAKQNLDVAKYLTNNMHPMPVETICNQCQQSVEKDLKGYLFLNQAEFPKTHDLSELLAMCKGKKKHSYNLLMIATSAFILF